MLRDSHPSPRPVDEIASSLDLGLRDYEPYGRHKAKLALGLERKLTERPLGRYVDVTAITPTPFGEGKTVVTIALAMALCREGKKAIATLREPSLAPVFGIKGGGAGGGRATLLPSDDVNLHFTGDMHAVTSATNLLAAMIDNHVKRGKSPILNPASITWQRCIDICDKGLSRIVTGLGNLRQAPLRETGFELTAASELMAVLSLATSFQDLRTRLGRVLVGQSTDDQLVFAEDLRCAGAMAALLRDAARPNLVQTCEHTPALVHTGPFGNIAHGNCSILADLAAVRLGDYVITESGFGADCGAEKFFDIKCRISGLRPTAEVLVCSVRALKMHSGRFRVRAGKPLPAELLSEDLESIREGSENLAAHIDIIRQFGLPVVVAVNQFPTDTDRELELVRQLAQSNGATAAEITDAFRLGSDGATSLARALIQACDKPNQFEFLYPLDMPPEDKFQTIATKIYGGEGVDFEPAAVRQLRKIKVDGFGQLPVCIAKTQYSLSHDPTRKGRPRGFRIPIREVRLASGADFIYALAGDIGTMPGLPSKPAANCIDVDSDGNITGLR